MISRSLTNPFNSDPTVRCGMTCHVKTKRDHAMKIMNRVETRAGKKRTTFRSAPPIPLQSKNGLRYEINEVLGKIKCKCGEVKFLVNWKGYPNSMNSCISKLPIGFRGAQVAKVVTFM
jgi:hypothetical protein